MGLSQEAADREVRAEVPEVVQLAVEVARALGVGTVIRMAVPCLMAAELEFPSLPLADSRLQ